MDDNNTYYKENFDFLEERDFGEQLGTPFYFFRQEFKFLTRTLMRYAGPFFLAGLILMSFFSSSLTPNSSSSIDPGATALSFMLVGIIYMVSIFMVFVITISYISLYVKHGKDNYSINDVWTLAKKNILKSFGAGFLITIMVIPAFLFLYIPGIYLAIAFSFVFIALIHENLSIGEAISRSFKMISGNWWQTFGLLFVFGIILTFVSYIIILPLAFIGAYAFSATSMGVFQFGGILLAAMLYFVIYVVFIVLQQTLLSSVFFSIYTKREGGNILKKVAAINNEEEIKKEETVQEENVETLIFEEQSEEAVLKENFEKYAPKKGEEPKSDDTNNKDYDRFNDNDEHNRFTNNDDDNDRFKPKY